MKMSPKDIRGGIAGPVLFRPAEGKREEEKTAAAANASPPDGNRAVAAVFALKHVTEASMFASEEQSYFPPH